MQAGLGDGLPGRGEKFLGVNFILLDKDKKSLFIIKATFFDWAGNKQEFIFSRIQINRDMPDRTFDLIVPEDVEIIK